MTEMPRIPLTHSVMSLGKVRLQGAWRREMLHSSRRHRLYWLTRGQGRATVNCVTRGYGPNTAIYIPAGTQMSIELPPQLQGLELCLPADPALGLPESPLHMRISNLEAQANITSHIEKIEREIAGDAPAMSRALTAYSLLVSAWVSREAERQAATSLREKSQRLAELFAVRMEAQFRMGLGVADYAEQLQVTPTHLSRVCRDASGRPAHALITERTMAEARRLLVDTEMSARDIAGHLGFSSPAYFTRAFTQSAGKTPTAFRGRKRRS